jgi:hypothetical protein
MKIYYTYCLIDSLCNLPFYVGKGSGSRMYQHRKDALNSEYNHRSVHRKIQSIIKKGGSILYEKTDHPTEHDALNHEEFLITSFGRKDLKTGILCNLTDGGERGSNISDESIKIRAEKNTGKKRSKKSRYRMKQAQLQSIKDRIEKFGYVRSPASRAKQSKSTKGKKWTEKARNSIRSKPTAKRVIAYTQDYIFIGEYESISECGKQLKCDITTIWKICEGMSSRPAKNGKVYPMKTHHGYTFQYKI